MPRFKNLEQLVDDIQSGLVQLRAGKLAPDALDPLVHDARALSNRLLILRYKTREFIHAERDATSDAGGLSKEPHPTFRIGAAYQTSLIDAIEAVAKDRLDGPVRADIAIDLDPVVEPDPTPQQQSQSSLFDAAPAAETPAEPTLVATLEQRPVADLRLAFGIAEKYEFIQALFHDDASAFSKALDALDSAGSVEVAEAWLTQHVAGFEDWDREEQPIARFMEMIQRRYL
ncbi:MAG: hypothetical protein P8M07_07380 [Flavobacteriales bacterium]|nr:hypothetical protein [Flavobacteriales bacterium]